MARKGQSAAFLRRLRKRYHLGEFKPRRGRKKKSTTVYKDRITKAYEPNPAKRKFLLRMAMQGIAPLPGEKLNIAD